MAKNKEKGKLPVVLIVSIVCMVLIVVRLLIDIVWQKNAPEPQPEKPGTTEPVIDSSIPADLLDNNESEENLENGKIYPVREEYYFALSENPEYVENDYFDDALFIGDSITTGIPHYMEKTYSEIAVVAERGVHVYNILKDEKIRTSSGEFKTVLDASSEYGKRSKIYIMLGGNDLGYEEPVFTSHYEGFVDELKKKYPDAEIYLQSIPPVTETKEQFENYPNSNNADINRCNLLIMKIAEEKNVHYLDVAVVFMNEEGKLPADVSPDGVHFVEEYYYKWFDYLKKHTVE